MRCPYCDSSELKVIDSREGKDKSSIKRRRECSNCLKRFSTTEKILKLDLEIKKASGKIEEFSLEKIRRSVLRACEKRPVSLEQVDLVLNNSLDELKSVNSSVINTYDIGAIILNNLKLVDDIAFLKYAIVHNNYDSMQDFVSELGKLTNFENLYKKNLESKRGNLN